MLPARPSGWDLGSWHRRAAPLKVPLACRSGEVAASVADVAIAEHQLTPSVIMSCEPQIKGAKLLVLDANLSRESIQAASQVAALWSVPVLLEPVSVPKAAR